MQLRCRFEQDQMEVKLQRQCVKNEKGEKAQDGTFRNCCGSGGGIYKGDQEVAARDRELLGGKPRKSSHRDKGKRISGRRK